MESKTMNIEEWTRELPEVPTKKPSAYRWFWPDTDLEPTAMELWPNRYLLHLRPGYWGVANIDKPLTNPLKGEGIKEGEEVEEEIKKGVGKGKGLLK